MSKLQRMVTQYGIIEVRDETERDELLRHEEQKMFDNILNRKYLDERFRQW